MFTYLGPIDGHDLPVLKDVLSRAKKLKTPVLIHVVTKKGRVIGRPWTTPILFTVWDVLTRRPAK